MLILTIRTDKPESELGLYRDKEQVGYLEWQAHRQLAETIHKKLKEILKKAKLSLQDLEGVVVYEGPGSFTGLRIGMSVGNALADSYKIPIVACASSEWQSVGLEKLLAGENQMPVTPNYGSAALTGAPKK